ncbi:MAG: hypothetical protein GY714_25475 [Desulfobacterales bacterium]|nr:hypothetical protein [Desulfobacterales bacterium]
MTNHIKPIILIPLLIFFLTQALFSQTREEFEQYQKEQIGDFKKYKDERDGDFIKFLKHNWKEYDVLDGKKRDKKPKPVVIPKATPKKVPKNVISKAKKIKKVVVPKFVQKKPVIKKPQVKIEPQKKLDIIKMSFYSTDFTVFVDPKYKMSPIYTINKKAISDFWEKMSHSEYESFLKQVLSYKKQLKLNDWGYHYFLLNIAKKIVNQDTYAKLFVWFMSTKSGYETRVGYDKDKIYFLLPSKSKLYSIPFLTLSGKRYYAVSFDSKPDKFRSIYTYAGKYPKSNKQMDYTLSDLPAFKKNLRKKYLRFKYDRKNYNVSALYNKNLVKYFEYYPQTDLKIYFEAKVPAETRYSLLKEFKSILKNKNEVEAVSILLRFVQKAFPYKTDDKQFGREKYLLPGEMLSYQFSDCEDRSIFFAYLVKELVGLNVVGLFYPGHVATAVQFNSKVPGDFVKSNNNKFVVCDPTYINAGIGMAMPHFKNKKPSIIKIGKY